MSVTYGQNCDANYGTYMGHPESATLLNRNDWRTIPEITANNQQCIKNNNFLEDWDCSSISTPMLRRFTLP
jgi:hypothetical protein